VYGRRQSALGLLTLCSLGGDTVWPGGLHARVCHAFLVFPILLSHYYCLIVFFTCFVYATFSFSRAFVAMILVLRTRLLSNN